MSERMDFARFDALVAAYGATPSRWPEEERAAAQAFSRTDPRAAALLKEADTIDDLLFAHQVAEPSRTLRAMVLESAPRRRRLVGRLRIWWSSLAFGIAAAGGVLAGSAAMAALEPVTANVQLYQHDDVTTFEDTSEENAQ